MVVDILPSVNDTIGQKLRALRVGTGRTQEQFADLVGLTQTGVSKIESGSRMPSRSTVDAWLAVCGKTMEIAGISTLSEGEREVMAAISGVEPDDLFLLAEAIRGLAVVKGADRAMARQTLQWLADRAPSPVGGDESPLVTPETPARVRQ